jgi:16S rRNA (cytosine967-C5)-methyltransferase
VVDFCAGAGGKTLALGALMRNTGRLYALDTSAPRLLKLKPRLARSGLSNVWPIAISGLGDERLLRLAGKAGLVLVDAPCTGLGTLRRNPDLKWRQSESTLHSLVHQQAAILRAAARLVGPKGRLVYATCSTLLEENEDQIAHFLEAHPQFELEPVEPVLSRANIDLPQAWRPYSASGALRLWPHRTQTDGFFGVILVRKP